MCNQDPVEAVIWHCLNNYDYKNAIFLAERFYAEAETDESIFLLATSYYRAKQLPQAYWLLQQKSCLSPQCRYLQAHCAYELGHYSAAEHILINYNSANELTNFDMILKDFGDLACFALQLMGKVYRKSARTTMAKKAFHQTLKTNPFLWEAYVELCNMGEHVDAGETFKVTDFTLSMLAQCPCCCQISKTVTLDGDINKSFYTPKNNFNTCNDACNICSTPINDENFKFHDTTEENAFALLTEQFSSLTSISPVTPNCNIEKTIFAKQRIISEHDEPAKTQSAVPTEVHIQPSIHVGAKPHVFTPGGNTPTRSSLERQTLKIPMLNSETYSAKENKHSGIFNKRSPRKSKYRFTKERRLDESDEDNALNVSEKSGTNKNQNSPTIVSVGSINSKHSTQQHLQKTHLLELRKQSADKMMSLLHDFGTGYKLLSKYQCKEAIQHFEVNTPNNQHNSCAWQSLIAKCYYELQNYDEAANIFKRIHEAEPCRLAYMDIYSSCLWQLQQPIELSLLAQDLVDCDRLSPITWCVVGNCFSLQNDHATAIKVMQRAVQVDTDFVYGYTLLGYEHIYHEDLEEARSCFSSAIARDIRHYNAWFGIGTTYAKQEEHQKAEVYFRKALKIYPTNSVIFVHIAVMQHAREEYQQALITLNTASKLNPDNLIAKLQRAKTYLALKCYQQALQELEQLKNMAPKESIVFQLLGNVHQALGNNETAFLYFSWSTDKDSKKAEPFTPILPNRCL